MSPARTLIALVEPTRKPSTMQSTTTGTMSVIGMYEPALGTGIIRFLPRLPHLNE
jgi:hypothetical protein